MNSIFIRRSIREYIDKPVEKEKIEKILQAAMQAPSARNQQAWEFIVVTADDVKNKVSEIGPSSRLAAKSPVLIVMLGNRDEMLIPDKWAQDMGACAQNMLLQIVQEGMGGVWLGIYPDKDRVDAIRKIFRLPENIEPFGVISFGYSERNNKFTDRYKENKIHWEVY